MCGIWLCCGLSSSNSLHCNDAFTKISHRGPDAWRLEMDARLNNIIFGFHRLSIVDPLHGMQPMRVHSQPHLILLCNGEIFNCKQAFMLLGQFLLYKKRKELFVEWLQGISGSNKKHAAKDFKLPLETSCDVEVIIHLFARIGIVETVQQLDGEFGFCLVDLNERKVYVARDPYGVRPVFVLRTDNGVLGICSEAKGLVPFGRDVNTENWKVEQFLPGRWETHDIDASTGKTKLVDHGQFFEIGKTVPKFPINVALTTDVEENVRNLFIQSVRKRLMADRRIGCLLSGGLDSSLVAALVVKLAKEAGIQYPIQTYSIGMEGSPDLAAAQQVANFIGSEHFEIKFTEQDVAEVLDDVLITLETADITTVRASIGMYMLSRFIAKKGESVVILSGEGADELAQGYIYFRDAPDDTAAHNESLRLLKDIYLYDGLRADRTTANFSLELRLPFLDQHFTNYYLSLPASSRRPVKNVEKHLLRSAFSGTGLLPDSILWRPKEAFSDGVAALKKSLFQIIQDEINQRLNDIDLVAEINKFRHCPPKTKESLYYRRVFENHYAGQAEALMPYYWMPRWVQVDDPSARFIKHYNATAE